MGGWVRGCPDSIQKYSRKMLIPRFKKLPKNLKVNEVEAEVEVEPQEEESKQQEEPAQPSSLGMSSVGI